MLFIPPHLAEPCVIEAEKSHVRDLFGFERLSEKRYTTAQIDTAWTLAMWLDFMDWIRTRAPSGYQHLTWDQELAAARQSEGKGSGEVRL